MAKRKKSGAGEKKVIGAGRELTSKEAKAKVSRVTSPKKISAVRKIRKTDPKPKKVPRASAVKAARDVGVKGDDFLRALDALESVERRRGKKVTRARRKKK